MSSQPRRLLRVASYNCLHGISLRSGRIDLDATAEAIGGLDADVVALQEVDRGLRRSGGVDQVDELARRTGLHAVFAPALLGDPDTRWTRVPAADPGGAAYGVGLLTRPRPSAVRRIPLVGGGGGGFRHRGVSPRNPGWDREPRVALVADLVVAGLGVRIVTTHLSYLPWRGLAQLRAAAAAAGDGRAVLLGDLNLPTWPVRLALPGWRHAGGGPTYPAWRPRLQVDQLLVRGGLRVGDVVVGPPGPSDHLPLRATLALPPP